MPDNTFSNIQVLRAVAAGIVAYDHLQAMVARDYGMATDVHFGGFGVDVFFVISGFVMYISNRNMDRPVLPFLVLRFFRIVPLYWLATFALVFFYYLGFHPVGLTHFEPHMLLQSMAFVTTQFPDGRYDLILVVGWTLIYELFFYFLFALTFPLGSPKRSLLALSVVFSILIAIGLAFPDLPQRLSYFLAPILLEFLFGGALALLVMGWKVPSGTKSSVLGLGLLAILTGSAIVITLELFDTNAPLVAGSRAFVWGLPALLIVGGFVAVEKCGWSLTNRFALLLGSASYAFYLFHLPVMQGTVKVAAYVFPLQGWPGTMLATLCALGAVALASILIHLWIEVPVLEFGRRIVRRMNASGASPAGQQKFAVPSSVDPSIERAAD